MSWPWQSQTAARPIGQCPKCGGTRYENLVHHCSSSAVGWFPMPYPAPAEDGESNPTGGRPSAPSE